MHTVTYLKTRSHGTPKHTRNLTHGDTTTSHTQEEEHGFLSRESRSRTRERKSGTVKKQNTEASQTKENYERVIQRIIRIVNTLVYNIKKYY